VELALGQLQHVQLDNVRIGQESSGFCAQNEVVQGDGVALFLQDPETVQHFRINLLAFKHFNHKLRTIERWRSEQKGAGEIDIGLVFADYGFNGKVSEGMQNDLGTGHVAIVKDGLIQIAGAAKQLVGNHLHF